MRCSCYTCTFVIQNNVIVCKGNISCIQLFETVDILIEIYMYKCTCNTYNISSNIQKTDKHDLCRFSQMYYSWNLFYLVIQNICKITQRNNKGRANTCDPALKLLNEEITSDIQKHKQNIWKEHLDAHWNHRHNTHILWKTMHGLSNRAPPATHNNSITFNNKITNTPKHIANIRHLKHICPLGLIANYIKGRKANTTYRNHTLRRQFKTGVPQGSVLSPTLFNIYTSDLPPPSAPVQVMAYADGITITSTHTSTSAAKKYIQPYLQKVFA